MDIRKVKKLMELLEESGMSEIEIKEGEESVKIVRGNAQPLEVKSSFITADSLNAQSENNEVLENASGSSIKSPIVGTFYRKPGPDQPPFVEIGSQVNAGDVVCIVEAMKMMNEIKSEFTGKVSAINIADGQPVEVDQSLIVID